MYKHNYMNRLSIKELEKKLYPNWDFQERENTKRELKDKEVSTVSNNQYYKKIGDIMEKSLENPSMERCNDVFFFV